MRQFDPVSSRIKNAAKLVVNAAGDKFRAIDHDEPNPRVTENLDWDRYLRSRWIDISAEWHTFRDSGGRLPNMEWLVGQWLGNSGTWQGGVLLSSGRQAALLSRHFPVTMEALARIPGLRSALWSVLSPGASIPEHQGPNPGVLRLHLGVDCPADAALELESRVLPYRNGETVLFDDTAPHAAWNQSDRERVTLFCELLRPLPQPWHQLNRFSQDLLSLTPRLREKQRPDAWHIALNPHLVNRA